MYARMPGLLLAFHGCEKELRDAVVTNKAELTSSINDYDWLGHGVYFWENSQERALEFAIEKQARGEIEAPSVIGAVVSLDYCLDLVNVRYTRLVEDSYLSLKAICEVMEEPLPQNSCGPDKILRRLDCAVINLLIETMKDKEGFEFDSVRAAFIEGGPLYTGAGFYKKNHIQICIRNPNCIKGYFLPREPESPPE